MGLTHEGESKSGRFWPVPKDGVSSIGQLRNGIPDNYGWLVPGRNLPLDPLNNPPPHSTSVFTGVLFHGGVVVEARLSSLRGGFGSGAEGT